MKAITFFSEDDERLTKDLVEVLNDGNKNFNFKPKFKFQNIFKI
jgi:hypothetical protein